MAADLGLGADFYREAIRAAVKDLANLFIPGSALGVVLIEHVGCAFCQAAYDWLQRKKPPQRQQAIDGLARVPFHRSTAIAEEELHNRGFSADQERELVSYLSAIPMTARRAISRPNDGGAPTTLLTQLPQSYADLLRFVPIRAPRFQPGNQVPGHDYRLELLLGQGGFAEVWKARHILREKEPAVAVKFCLVPSLLVSLKNEIQLLDVLKDHSHPEDFVRLLATAYSADPPFLVYEYVDGGDLAAWLASFDGKPPSVSNVVRILRMVARALAFTHKRGVIHRDLKPANLLVTREGRIKLADFGIGAIVAEAEAKREHATFVTGATVLRGAHTPLYADSRSLGKAPDPKLDVYALGVIAYQLLIGDIKRPIGPAWRRELEENGIPANLLDIISDCVDVPSKRLSNAGALLAALEKRDANWPGREAQQAVAPDVAVNYCVQCGEKVHHDDRFCTHCGDRIR